MTVQKDPEGTELAFLHKFADLRAQRVLEVGCGDGRLTFRYAEQAAFVAGIDLERGVVIDVRPISNDWPIDVVSARKTTEVGRAGPSEEDQAADEAAQAAVAHAAAEGLFIREREERFRFHYYWDSPAELHEFVKEEWSDWIGIPDDVAASLRSNWAVADADARVRITLNMLITRWRKTA